jgi:hypothetical protein
MNSLKLGLIGLSLLAVTSTAHAQKDTWTWRKAIGAGKTLENQRRKWRYQRCAGER